MPIFAGTSGSSKILGLTKASDDQWNIKYDTIFHSSLPYVRVIEHEFTTYTNVADKLYEQDSNGWYWDQNTYGASRWWVGQRFDFSAQLINSLQNTNNGFMVFIKWNDGYWEPFLPLGYEHDTLFTWDNRNNFSYQQNMDVADFFKNTYGLTRYSTGIFIPRRKVVGQNKFDPNQYVVAVRVLELNGLEVYSDGSVGMVPQNNYQNVPIYVDNTSFVVGGVNIMQEKYLQLMTNVTQLSQTSKQHNVQQDMIYPASISYSLGTMDVVSQHRSYAITSQLSRNSQPITYSSGPTNNWDVMSPMVSNLSVISRVANWTQMTPDAQPFMGGVWVPRLSDPQNYDTYITQGQSYRRDDFTNRGITPEPYNNSRFMQVGVLCGNKFGSGVYLDSTRPQIGRGGRQLFSPDTQGVARVGPTRKFITPREVMMTGGLGQTTILQMHNKTILTSIQLNQEEYTAKCFLVTLQPQFNPTALNNQGTNQQITTQPPTSVSQLRKTKRSNQDQGVGYTIQGYQVSDDLNDRWVQDLVTFTGAFRSTSMSRQVHQISLLDGDRFIINENECGANPDQNYVSSQSVGLIHYIERVGNTINLVSETYISNNYNTSFSIIGPDGIFCGGWAIGLT